MSKRQSLADRRYSRAEDAAREYAEAARVPIRNNGILYRVMTQLQNSGSLVMELDGTWRIAKAPPTKR